MMYDLNYIVPSCCNSNVVMAGFNPFGFPVLEVRYSIPEGRHDPVGEAHNADLECHRFDEEEENVLAWDRLKT